MPTPKDEAARLIAASGLNQTELAAELTNRLKRTVKSYTVSRIVSGDRQPKADELDALRAIAGEPRAERGATQPSIAARVPRLTESAEVIPLYGAAAGPGGSLRLGEANLLGSVPVHPAQKGANEPFAFVVPDNRLADRLLKGEVAFALKHRQPFHGQMCLVEMKDGGALPYIYDREDDHTLFVRVKSPKVQELRVALKDVTAIHVIVGATFGPG